MRGLMGRSVAVAAVVGALAATLAGCGGGDDVLVIYSGRTSNLILPLLEQFADETGISIDVRYETSQNLALLIDEEGEATPADVFISQSPGAVGYLDTRGRLAELPSELLELVPEGDAAQDGTWVGLSGRVRTLVYNTAEVDDPATLPDSVLDLADERYAGRVAVAPTNASFQDFVTVLRTHVGEEETERFLQALADGDAPTYENNTAIVEAVGRGEVPLGLVNHYYAFVAREEDPGIPVENHFFAPGDYGSTLLVTAASMVEGTDRPDEARRFVEFLLSEEAQRYFSEETYEYPLARGVEAQSDLRPLDEIDPTRVELGELGEGLDTTTDLIDASGLSD